MRFAKYAAVIATVGALALTGCSGSSSSSDETKTDVTFEAGSTMQKLHDAGSITVGTKFDQPLFGLKGLDGTPEGFDVEVAKIVAQELGIPANKITWKESVSANREPFIQNGQVDMVVATYTINDKRKQVVSFAGPYYIAGQDFLVLKGNPDKITGIDSVKGKKVCSVTGSTSAAQLKERGVDVLETDTYSNCLQPLRQGQVVAVSTDNVILAGLADQNPGEFEVVGKPFTTEDYGIGIKKDDTQFQKFINDTIVKAQKDGRWQKAWDKTAGKVLPTPEPVTPGSNN